MTNLKETIKAKIKTQPTETLKEMAVQLMDNYEDGAGVVFVFTLDELEERMTESEYITFTDSL